MIDTAIIKRIAFCYTCVKLCLFCIPLEYCIWILRYLYVGVNIHLIYVERIPYDRPVVLLLFNSGIVFVSIAPTSFTFPKRTVTLIPIWVVLGNGTNLWTKSNRNRASCAQSVTIGRIGLIGLNYLVGRCGRMDDWMWQERNTKLSNSRRLSTWIDLAVELGGWQADKWVGGWYWWWLADKRKCSKNTYSHGGCLNIWSSSHHHSTTHGHSPIHTLTNQL